MLRLHDGLNAMQRELPLDAVGGAEGDEIGLDGDLAVSEHGFDAVAHPCLIIRPTIIINTKPRASTPFQMAAIQSEIGLFNWRSMVPKPRPRPVVMQATINMKTAIATIPLASPKAPLEAAKINMANSSVAA